VEHVSAARVIKLDDRIDASSVGIQGGVLCRGGDVLERRHVCVRRVEDVHLAEVKVVCRRGLQAHVAHVKQAIRRTDLQRVAGARRRSGLRRLEGKRRDRAVRRERHHSGRAVVVERLDRAVELQHAVVAAIEAVDEHGGTQRRRHAAWVPGARGKQHLVVVQR